MGGSSTSTRRQWSCTTEPAEPCIGAEGLVLDRDALHNSRTCTAHSSQLTGRALRVVLVGGDCGSA